MFKIGNGYDVHQLTNGNSIRLAGIDIPSEYQIVAHSDGDIVLHALMDAMLGALAENDIGTHFPDTDQKYQNADSTLLLQEVNNMMKNKEYKILNIDITIVLEKPKLRPHIQAMKNSIRNILKLTEDQVNIKATTSEKMGFVGKFQGIECYAVCLLARI